MNSNQRVFLIPDRSLPRRLERLHAQHVGEDAALFGRKEAPVANGVELRLALLDRNPAQIAEGGLHLRLTVHRQFRPAARREVDAHPLLGR